MRNSTLSFFASLLFIFSSSALFAEPDSHEGRDDREFRDPHLGDEARPPHHAQPFLSTAPNGLTPDQIRQAYGFSLLTANGVNQTIAIVDAYGSPTIQGDLDKFCAKFGIPSTTVTISYPQGKPSKSDNGWALETSLDVEWAHAIAPSAKILLVVAKSPSFNDLFGAIDAAVNLSDNNC